MRCFGVLLLGLVGCSGSDFGAADPLPSAGMGGEVVTAGTGGTAAASAGGSGADAGAGGRAGAPQAGASGATTAGAGGAGGGAGEPTEGSGGAAAGMSGMGGTGDAGQAGSPAGAGGGAGTTGGAAGAGMGGSSSGAGAGATAGAGGSAGAEPSLLPQPAANCPGFFDYYVPVGTCIWFQGEWEYQTPECDLVSGGEQSGCAVVDAIEAVGPGSYRLKPGDQFMEPKRYNLESGSCPKVCQANP